ncbi:unnamed protein product [Allacma fusca]|uniref:Mab-21-like HhH/H2TH-like domain-containing protein n=1 Tax=Allacma fusca TaxID=39272 RepID=A0A8J2JGI8_9HEXA|nr:unnamed protein product [Allacma fusca]
MGNCQSGESVIQSSTVPEAKPKIINGDGSDSDDEGKGFFNNFKNREELKSYVDRFQEVNYKRLYESFKNDKELFILNQLLMSIQFFPNFDKSLLEAKEFKRTKESDLNAKLSGLIQEGVVGGERRVKLMHGMGEILAKHFIYRSEIPQEYDNNYETNDNINTQKKLKPSSFMSEGILPLDFYINYENYEVFTASDWSKLKDNDYFSPTDAPLFRFSMEESNEENRIPRGYVRILCGNSTMEGTHLQLKTPDSLYDYSNTSETYIDRLSEAKSSYASSMVSEDDGDSMLNMQAGEKMLHRLNKRITSLSTSQSTRQELITTKGESYHSEGMTPKSYNLTTVNISGPPLSDHELEKNPTIHIEEPHSPSIDNFHDELSRKLNDIKRTDTTGLLRPTWTPTKPKAWPNVPKETSREATDVLNPFQTTSEVTSNSSVKSTSSVPFSAGIRRRPLELKELWQYQRKHKFVVQGPVMYEISPDCLIQVKVDKEDDPDETSDEESESDSSSLDTRGSHHSSDEGFIIKSYLSSTQFSALACSDFNIIATKIGINSSKLSEAQVLGSTIRICVDYSIAKGDNFQLLHTFTPTLQCKVWPAVPLIWFKQRLLRPKHITHKGKEVAKPEEMSWPSRIQVENIEGFGSTVIPQGFHSVDFFNAQQSMEWLVNFSQGENLLLNSFKNVHWRAYIMSAILFRAFIFPMGPRGVGLEHIRNIIYQMCEQDYVFWDYEDGGLHLRAILSRLCNSLSTRQLPNFFIPRYNMLKSSVPENTRKVQAHLSSIRENIIVFCIYALRNLTCLHERDSYYYPPDLKKLYRLVTSPNAELLLIANPYLRQALAPDITNNNNPKKGKTKALNITNDNNQLDATFEKVIQFDEPDKQRDKMLRKYKRYLDKQTKAEEELARIKAEKELKLQAMIPKKERRKSIDLEASPVTKYTNRRIVMLIEFFVQHFLKMAEKAITFHAWADATMYTLHVQNLCRLMKGIRLDSTHMEHTTIEAYMRQSEQLRNKLGAKTAEYVKSKLSHLELPDGTSALFLNQSSPSSRQIPSNFVLSPRTTPTPQNNSLSKKLGPSGAGLTLQNFPSYHPNFSPSNFNPEVHDEFQLSQLDNLSRPRRQTLRYIHTDLQERGFIKHT